MIGNTGSERHHHSATRFAAFCEPLDFQERILSIENRQLSVGTMSPTCSNEFALSAKWCPVSSSPPFPDDEPFPDEELIIDQVNRKAGNDTRASYSNSTTPL
jgi:hypothetical protein